MRNGWRAIVARRSSAPRTDWLANMSTVFRSPKESNRTSSGLVPAAAVPTRTAENGEGIGGGIVAGPSSNIATAQEETVDWNEMTRQEEVARENPHSGGTQESNTGRSGWTPEPGQTMVSRLEVELAAGSEDCAGGLPMTPKEVAVRDGRHAGKDGRISGLTPRSAEGGRDNTGRFRDQKSGDTSETSGKRPRSSPIVESYGASPPRSRQRGKSRSASGFTISDDSEIECTLLDNGKASGRATNRPRVEGEASAAITAAKPAPRRKARTQARQDVSAEELSDTEFEVWSSVDLGSAVLGWLEMIDQLRLKSGKLQGAISGQMKSNLANAREAVQVLVERAEAKGDPKFLAEKVDALKVEVKNSNRKASECKRELDFSESRNEELRGKIRKLKEKGYCDNCGCAAPKSTSATQTSPRNDGRYGTQPQDPAMIVETKDDRIDECIKAVRGMEENLREMSLFLGNLRVGGRGEGGAQMEATLGGVGRGFTERGKARPRIISDIQLVPPRNETQNAGSTDGEGKDREGQTPWSLVKNRPRGRRRSQINSVDLSSVDGAVQEPRAMSYADKLRHTSTGGRSRAIATGAERPLLSRRRAPRSAAVAIRPINIEQPLADLMRKARGGVSLEDFGIVDSRIRRTANGSLLVEIPGPEGSAKADKLADRLRTALQGEAMVSRPTIKSDFRLIGVDDSVSPQEIVSAISEAGGCTEMEVKTGPLRPMRNGLNIVWAQCPLNAANRIAAVGRIRIGWSSARVESLGVRPKQCYKCWEFGHVRGMCRSQTDRTGHCFQCGAHGHSIATCTAPPQCVLCREGGRNWEHRLGSVRCEARRGPPVKPRESVGVGGVAPVAGPDQQSLMEIGDLLQ